MIVPPIEYGAAQFVLPGENKSGDCFVVCGDERTILISVIDGIGHGEEAASASERASSVLRAGFHEPIISLVERCHASLRQARGVVMSLASIDIRHGMMTWLGVGNVQGVLLRAGPSERMMREVLLLRAGVIGSQLPSLQAIVTPIAPGDTVVFATDGVRGDFMESLSVLESPQRAAERILQSYNGGNDDALVLLARLTESP